MIAPFATNPSIAAEPLDGNGPDVGFGSPGSSIRPRSSRLRGAASPRRSRERARTWRARTTARDPEPERTASVPSRKVSKDDGSSADPTSAATSAK